jgi:hypothetical protein
MPLTCRWLNEELPETRVVCVSASNGPSLRRTTAWCSRVRREERGAGDLQLAIGVSGEPLAERDGLALSSLKERCHSIATTGVDWAGPMRTLEDKPYARK